MKNTEASFRELLLRELIKMSPSTVVSQYKFAACGFKKPREMPPFSSCQKLKAEVAIAALNREANEISNGITFEGRSTLNSALPAALPLCTITAQSRNRIETRARSLTTSDLLGSMLSIYRL